MPIFYQFILPAHNSLKICLKFFLVLLHYHIISTLFDIFILAINNLLLVNYLNIFVFYFLNVRSLSVNVLGFHLDLASKLLQIQNKIFHDVICLLRELHAHKQCNICIFLKLASIIFSRTLN